MSAEINSNQITKNKPSKKQKAKSSDKEKQSKVLNTIRRVGSLRTMSIRKLPFQRLVKKISDDISKEKANKNENPIKIRFTKQALTLVQFTTEQKILRLFENAYLCTLHAKRVTLFNKDIRLARRLGSF